jgi:gamma-glutamylcyclotransferase (GGCT)/AIG2-like uncharacterized protein YtfP
MSSGTTHLFVYGSLRSGFQSPAYDYISQYFELISEAKVSGTLADMGPYPAAAPTPAAGFIVGELYRLKHESQFGWAFGQLDDYEGVIVEADERPLYRREMTAVATPDGTRHEAWIYWYNGDIAGYPVVTSGDILEYIKQKSSK